MKRTIRPAVLATATLLAATFTVGLAQPATTISLEVGDGPHQGSYRVTSQDITCTYGYAGEGLWGNQYSIDVSSPETFSSLQLIVDTRAASEGSAEFLASVSFGPLFTPESATYTISTRSNDEGSGFITLDDRGASGTVHFTGHSGDGIPLEATIECHTVLRSGPSSADLARQEAEESAPPGALALSIGGESFDFTPTVDEAYCAEAMAEERDFQYTFYPTDSNGEITGVEVYLYDTGSLGNGADFYLSISTQDDGYYVDSSEGVEEGSGTVNLENSGDRRTVSVSATTAAGVPLQVRLECRAE